MASNKPTMGAVRQSLTMHSEYSAGLVKKSGSLWAGKSELLQRLSAIGLLYIRQFR
jgi:hypothetical protein